MRRIKNILTNEWLILLIIAVASFLRLYRLPEFTMFLSDQGRDAIIVKDIITFKHFPAIGAPTSLGQVYLGPFYYYLIAPFLLIFNFNPVGMSYGVAFLSIVGIILSYLIIRKEFDKLTSLFFLIIISFSSINIEQSRFSWNPNLLPFFAFFTLYFFYQLIKTNKIIYSILFGSFLSFSFQLHYLAVFLILPITLLTLINFKTFKKKLFSNFFIYLIAFIFFLFFSSPLLIFDLRHQFLNTQNLLKLITQQEITHHYINISQIIFFTLSVITVIFSKKHKPLNNFLILNFLNIFLFSFGFSFLNSKPLLHYFSPIYLSLFLAIAIFLTFLKKVLPRNITTIFTVLFFILYVIFNAKNYDFLKQKANNQITHSKKVAEFLAEKIKNKPFNIATWPVEFSEDNYVYFLHLKGLYPADRKRVEITDQMFVLCNKEPCQILNSPSWNISMFGPAKIDKIWNVEGIKIFKLVHK